MSSTATEGRSELSGLTGFRDRLAYLGERRERVLRAAFCGLAMAFVVLAACRVPTPLSKWSWLLALCALGSAMLRVRLGALIMGCVCTVQMLSLHGQLGFVTAFLSLVFVIVCEHQAVRWFAVLLAPYALRAGLGVAVPLGLAVSATRRGAWFWALLAFAWSLMHGLAVGQPRLGVAPLPRFAEAAQALRPQASGKADGTRTPAASGKVTAGTTSSRLAKSAPPSAPKPVSFGGAWLRQAVSEADLGELRDATLQLAVSAGRNGPLMAQLLIWCGIVVGVRALYFRRRLKDRLALEYLEKMTRQVQHAAVPIYRRLPVALLVGLLAFVVSYLVLAAVAKDIHYGLLQVLLDTVSVAVAFLPLWAGLEGDSHSGRQTTSPRGLEGNAGHGTALKDLPVGGGGVPRRSGSVRPGSATPSAGRTAFAGAAQPPRAAGDGVPAATSPVGDRPASPPTPAPPPSGARTTSGPAMARTPSSHGGRAASAVEAVAFIDMVGSTAMGSKYGDEFVFKLKERLGMIVRAECKRHEVLFSKGTGDGFMLTFPEAENAVSAAMNILREIRRENADLPEGRSIHLRFGIHMGQVNIDSRGDRIGTTANFAARIEGAKIEQLQAAEDPANVQLPEKDRILVSDVVHDELKDHPGYPMRALGYFEFKGITGLHRIYEVIVR